MDRELLLEIGCEELPASWLPALTEQLAQRLGQRLKDFRLTTDGPVESSATPRRLTAHVTRVAERQSDLEENVSGPAVAAAFAPDGTPTPAAVGFARKYGVEVSDLTRVTTPKGEYLSVVKRERGRAAVDVLPDVLGATLRDLPFPKQMRWDAWIDDGKGEFTFGRPIRWMLFLFGGRVVPFVIRRSPGAQSSLVQDVRTGALTYGHRFLAMSGRPGRSVKVRSVSDYKQRLGEHFILLEHPSGTIDSCANSMRMRAVSAVASPRSRRCCTRSPTSWSTRRWWPACSRRSSSRCPTRSSPRR